MKDKINKAITMIDSLITDIVYTENEGYKYVCSTDDLNYLESIKKVLNEAIVERSEIEP